MKSKIKVIIEKTNDGISAYADKISLPVGTIEDNLEEARDNMVEAINLYNEYSKKRKIGIKEIRFQFDLTSFFAYYKIINAKALAERIGMHQSLLAQYTTGKKQPSALQVERILKGLQDVGRELLELQIL